MSLLKEFHISCAGKSINIRLLPSEDIASCQ